MKTLLIIFSFIFIGCKPKEPTPVAPSVSVPAPTVSAFETSQKTLSMYTTKFEDDYLSFTGNTANLSGLTISIDSSLNGTSNIGSCTGSVVKFQETFWNSNSTTNSQREQLVFHELKHCYLNSLTHDNSTIITTDDSRSVPKSIMNESPVSDSFYRKNRTYYLEELFNEPITNNPETNNSDEFPENYY